MKLISKLVAMSVLSLGVGCGAQVDEDANPAADPANQEALTSGLPASCLHSFSFVFDNHTVNPEPTVYESDNDPSTAEYGKSLASVYYSQIAPAESALSSTCKCSNGKKPTSTTPGAVVNYYNLTTPVNGKAKVEQVYDVYLTPSGC